MNKYMWGNTYVRTHTFWRKIDNVCGPTFQNILDLEHDDVVNYFHDGVHRVRHSRVEVLCVRPCLDLEKSQAQATNSDKHPLPSPTMSPGRLSFSPLQDGPNYNFNTPGPYNASTGNPYGNGNGQFSVPTPPISAWGGNSQTTQEQQYNVSVYAHF